jgi:hypothetical protein
VFLQQDLKEASKKWCKTVINSFVLTVRSNQVIIEQEIYIYMDINHELMALIDRNDFLKPIVFKVFKNDKELDLYEQSNKNLFDEYYDNQEKIDTIKWDLMTPEQQTEYKAGIELFKLKRGGNL